VRIAVATRFVHRVGGVETYLAGVLPALADRGHEVAVWHEFDVPSDSTAFVPAQMGTYRIRTPGGASDVLDDLAAWRPELVFSQGMADVTSEKRLRTIAPTVAVMHDYRGACISGTKLHAFPVPRPCTRALGPGCLTRYHALRCGGWSPVTMATEYAEQRQRQTTLRTSAFVVTLSEHMRREAVIQGVRAERVVCVPAFVPPATVAPASASGDELDRPTGTRHLVFVGRMERLKGAGLFVAALERLASSARHALKVTFVGDGRERARVEQKVHRLRASGLDSVFTGWLPPQAVLDVFKAADLCVVPSVWPEPLGFVGLEAAAQGLPCVAFDVGGMSDWLHDQETGMLIKGPISAAALARAIEACLSDVASLRRWGRAAAEQASHRSVDRHVRALEAIFQKAAALRDVRRVG
jgi:glycosyltransferase involved in cell wall biosynthesis